MLIEPWSAGNREPMDHGQAPATTSHQDAPSEEIDVRQVLKSVRTAVASLRRQAGQMHFVLQAVRRLPVVPPEALRQSVDS
jgi:hypothetical protein